MNKTEKKFDCVKMALDIKEALYKENKHLSISDYLKKISGEIQHSPYWKGKQSFKEYKSKKELSANKKSVESVIKNKRKLKSKRKELA